MTMANGKAALRKIAFQVGDRFFRFAINPDTMVYSRPHRATTVKTKSRIVVEDFGSDIATVTIGGTTGYNPTGVSSDRGVQKIRELKDYLMAYADMGANGNKSSEDFYFHDFTNKEHYVVHLSSEGVNYTQDANSPLTHRYDIKFTILRKASDPPDDQVVSPEIGNRFPTLPTGPGGFTGGQGTGTSTGNNPSNSGVGSGAQDSNGNKSDDKPYDPTSGNDKIYNKGTEAPINPQAPSPNAYNYGQTGLGYAIGYYLRDRGIG
ncbi:hypothetical protein CPT_Mater160 [Bacillus phage Mater]|uniref:Uncharacterized protein n=1 Tax=Bacillus phage Mater TaxID=1540090 RepID=A0A0A0RMV3_9CAUD|nr:virion structural protein [Bacillus phage Mater]AIW03317.1 hypothetical protein CPT_Mater160 [Bacillus phage Mater]